MITPRSCIDATDIRVTIRTHQAELAREMQEVRITATHLPHSLCGVLRRHQEETDCDPRDSVVLVTNGEVMQVTIELNDITRFEVLATRLMTPAHAYRQMKEMERIVGL